MTPNLEELARKCAEDIWDLVENPDDACFLVKKALTQAVEPLERENAELRRGKERLGWQKGQRYLVWNTSQIGWILHGEKSDDLTELEVLDVAQTAVKFKNKISEDVFWSTGTLYKIKEEL